MYTNSSPLNTSHVPKNHIKPPKWFSRISVDFGFQAPPAPRPQFLPGTCWAAVPRAAPGRRAGAARRQMGLEGRWYQQCLDQCHKCQVGMVVWLGLGLLGRFVFFWGEIYQINRKTRMTASWNIAGFLITHLASMAILSEHHGIAQWVCAYLRIAIFRFQMILRFGWVWIGWCVLLTVGPGAAIFFGGIWKCRSLLFRHMTYWSHPWGRDGLTHK